MLPGGPRRAGAGPSDPPAYFIDGVPPDAAAQLYTYAFGLTPDGKPKLIVSYLLWAPLTESIKCGLAAKGKGTEMPSRQAFANFAKDFIDDKLADVVLYGGTYRESVMRPSVQAALCIVIDGKPSQRREDLPARRLQRSEPSSSPSLGGYMMMDAIDDELRGERVGTKRSGRRARY